MISDKKDIEQNLSKEEILEKLFREWQPVAETEIVTLEESYGRVLAEDQTAQYDLPVVRASSMDGVAVKSEYFRDGIPDTSSWRLGREFVRADTGDDFDDAYDCIIRIEDVEISEDGRLTLNLTSGEQIEPGANVRPAGSMLRRGALLAKAGRVITAPDLASLAAGGITSVPVVRKPKVGFIPTGSELIPAGDAPGRGQNVDCNSILAKHMILEMGGEPVCYPIVKDKKAELASAVDRALSECDIVLINGGSSKGEEDFNTRILGERGKMISHWVKAAPGRPMGVAVADNKPLINLSGPTIAAFHGLEWCLRPVIARFLGTPVYSRRTIQAVLTEDIHAPGVIEFLCMLHASRTADGGVEARPTDTRNSGNPPLSANAMLITRLGRQLYQADETVEIQLLRPLEEI